LTATDTPCGYPGNTCTFTFTPTATNTPLLGDNLPYPNPWDGSQPLAFYHTVSPNTNRVTVKIFTLAFRRIFEDYSLDITAGPHLYTLDWNKTGNIANGLYYLVIIDQLGGQQTQKVMKILVQR
jgi:hypothetical protein